MSKETVFKVGQRVFSAHYGWGVIECIYNSGGYPMQVVFANTYVRFNRDGREYQSNEYPSLSFTNYIEDRFSLDPKDAKYELKLEFDWDCLPAWANKYIAKDRDGSWCAYNEEPIKDVIDGMFDGSNYVDIPRKFKPTNGDDIEWENSILKNPNHD